MLHSFVISELPIVMQEMMWLAINMIFSSVATEKLQSSDHLLFLWSFVISHHMKEF